MNKENTVVLPKSELNRKTDDLEPSDKKVLLDKGQIQPITRSKNTDDGCPSSPLGTALLKRKREFQWKNAENFVLMPCENCPGI